MIEQKMNQNNQNSSYLKTISFLIKQIFFFLREPPKNRNRPYKDSDAKWQHDLYCDYDDESNSHYSNYRGQAPRRGRGRGRFELVLIYKLNSFFYSLFSVAVVVVVVIEINYI